MFKHLCNKLWFISTWEPLNLIANHWTKIKVSGLGSPKSFLPLKHEVLLSWHRYQQDSFIVWEEDDRNIIQYSYFSLHQRRGPGPKREPVHMERKPAHMGRKPVQAGRGGTIQYNYKSREAISIGGKAKMLIRFGWSSWST